MYLILFVGLLILYLPMTVYFIAGILILRRLKIWGWRKSSIVIVIFLATPWACWEASRLWADSRRSELNTFVSSVPIQKLDGEIPATIVVESYGASLTERPGVRCVRRLVVNKVIMARDIGYTGPPWVELDARTGHEIGITQLPARYLRFSSDSLIDVKLPREPTSDRRGPWELELVDGSSKKIVGFHYDEVIKKPTFPPVLTWGGWLGQALPSRYSPKEAWPIDFVNSLIGNC